MCSVAEQGWTVQSTPAGTVLGPPRGEQDGGAGAPAKQSGARPDRTGRSTETEQGRRPSRTSLNGAEGSE